MFPDNGFAHVTEQTSDKDTIHKVIFELKLFLTVSSRAWSVVRMENFFTVMCFSCDHFRALESFKVLFIFEERISSDISSNTLLEVHKSKRLGWPNLWLELDSGDG